MLKIGCIGFGGGSALIPVMERELVQGPVALSPGEFTRHVVVANVTPGALPVKLAALAGSRLGGPWLALGSACAVMLPGAAGTVGLLALFAAIGDQAISYLGYASIGITSFIVFLLGRYVVRVVGSDRVSLVICLLAFLITGAGKTARLLADTVGHSVPELPALSSVELIVWSLVGIALYTVVHRGARLPREVGDGISRVSIRSSVGFAVLGLTAAGLGLVAAADVVTPRYVAAVAGSTVSSFGGGESYVAVADAFFVGDYVTAKELYGQIIPIANALPGPILVKVAAGVGYVFGAGRHGSAMAWLAAAVTALIATATCSCLAMAVHGAYSRIGTSPLARNVHRFILPVICGLLVTTAVSMLEADIEAARQVAPGPVVLVGAVVLTLANWAAHRRMHIPDLALIAASGALTLALCVALR
jgi:chromate transporter